MEAPSSYPRRKLSPSDREAMQREALTRAASGQSWTNVPTIIAEFSARGIPADQIEPRVNVFTYQAWRALGRQVRRGEKGVKVVTWIHVEKRDEKTGQMREDGKRPWSATVFHITQTELMGESLAMAG